MSDYSIFPGLEHSPATARAHPYTWGWVGGYIAEGGRAWVLVVLNLPDGTEPLPQLQTTSPAGQMFCE